MTDAQLKENLVIDGRWAWFNNLGLEYIFYDTDAYRWLAGALGIPGKECHIAMMSADMARRVVQEVEARG